MVVNYGLALLEAAVAIVILYLIVIFLKKILPEEKKLQKNVKGSVVSCLIVFGIIYGIRFLIESLEYYFIIFGFLNNNFFFFAIMTTLFYPIYKFFLRDFDKDRKFEDKDLPPKIFVKRYKMVIGLTWVIAVIFFSFDLLQLQLIWERFAPNYDMFYIGNFTALFTVLLIAILFYLINKAKPIEDQLPKEEFKSALIYSGIISFGIWSIQIIIFDMYLSRIFDLTLIIQDLRVLVIVIFGIFIICYYNLLRVKFLPESIIKSRRKVQYAIVKEKEKINHARIQGEEQAILDAKILDDNFNEQENVVYSVESISYKLYLFLLKKFGSLDSLDEKSIRFYEKGKRQFKNIFMALLWILTLVMVAINLIGFLSNLNPIVDMFFLSIQWAFFMVLIDISITLLFNKIIPAQKRIPKEKLKKTFLFGGIILLWIWVVPLFIIYYYLFMGVYEIIIPDIFSAIINSFIMFIIGIYITRWVSGRKGFDTSLRKAAIINFLWFIINIPLSIFFLFLFGNILLNDLLLIIIDIFIGAVFVMKIYKKEFKPSINFGLNIKSILFLLVIIIVESLLSFIQAILPTYHFNVQDIRVHIIVDISIYLVFFAFSSKVKLVPITQKKMRKIQEISPKIAEALIPGREIEKKVILEVKDLTTYFYTEEGVVRAVERVSFKIYEGETLGLVGETGCGKSVTALSILQVVRPPGKIKSGKIIFQGEDLLQKTEEEILKYRGNNITMIFQDPLNSINPIFKVGKQISEVYLLHKEDELLIEAMKHSDKSIYSIAQEWSEQLLRDLNIPAPESVYNLYPHELSGGMRQRIQVAMGLACSPKLLIADEPTTALDVTIQNQILQLMKNLCQKYDTSILFITHDLGIISKMCDRVAVMYSGFIVEYGDIYKLFETPYHPYTRGLIESIPVIGKKKEELEVIPGLVPNLIYPPSGCRFNPRCRYCFEPCNYKVPKSIEIEPNYFVACHLYDPEYIELAEISKKKVDGKASINE